MRAFLTLAAAVVLAGCATQQPPDPPILSEATAATLQDFDRCFGATAPGTAATRRLLAGSKLNYIEQSEREADVYWIVSVEDLGSERQVTVYAGRQDPSILGDVRPCI